MHITIYSCNQNYSMQSQHQDGGRDFSPEKSQVLLYSSYRIITTPYFQAKAYPCISYERETGYTEVGLEYIAHGVLFLLQFNYELRNSIRIASMRYLVASCILLHGPRAKLLLDVVDILRISSGVRFIPPYPRSELKFVPIKRSNSKVCRKSFSQRTKHVLSHIRALVTSRRAHLSRFSSNLCSWNLEDLRSLVAEYNWANVLCNFISFLQRTIVRLVVPEVSIYCKNISCLVCTAELLPYYFHRVK